MCLQLSKKYGPVFTVHMGPQKVVVLAGFKAVKEALVTNAEVFGERSVPMIAEIIVHNNGADGVFRLSGEEEAAALSQPSSEMIVMNLNQAFYSPTATRGER